MNWIDSQCGSPRWTRSNSSIASRKKVLAPLPVAKPLEPGAAEHRAARPQPLADRLRRSSAPRAKSRRGRTRSSPRCAISSRRSRARMPGRIMFGSVRLAAEPVRAKVGHDHPEARRGDPRRVAELDPVHVGVGEQAVEQDRRAGPARARDRRARRRRTRSSNEPRPRSSGKLPVASTHLSTSV